jgi:dipeptidyl aminopeptidase/acylaminoacyl peptidase
MNKISLALGLIFACVVALGGERPPIEKFFEGQRINGVSISPDGRYLALEITADGIHYLGVLDRQQKTGIKPIMQLERKDRTSFRWCKWAKSDRVLCSIMFSTNSMPSNTNLLRAPSVYMGSTRVVAINADGSNKKLLVDSKYSFGGQFQDDIIDWIHDDPDNVLIALRGYAGVVGSGHGDMEVKRLNIRTGSMSLEESGNLHTAGFATDGKGHVRLAEGIEGTTYRLYAKAKDSKSWKEIVKRVVDLKTEGKFLDPVAVIPDTNEAYAIGDYEGYKALWTVNLSGDSEPLKLFSQPNTDVYPLFGPDHQLLGVGFDSDTRSAKYFNSNAQLAQEVVNQFLPNRANQLIDFTRDMKTVVVRTQTDKDPPSFLVLDLSVRPAKVERIGSSYPGLKGYELASVEPINFTASDGAMVPGYLTRPIAVVDASKTPLIVLPHGGPYARDRWGFDSWVQYLASRGYAVLQVEFRGSTGFGTDWFQQGFADWGGKPYSDVVDGTKWALSKGYGDSSRVCIVGASFGGYMALLSATRNVDSKLFKCAVSISGVSDLRELLKDRQNFAGYQLAKQSIGTDGDKLRDDSPRTHAKEINIPVMLIHGDEDFTVDVEESRIMNAALDKTEIPHELIVIKGADHYFRDDEYLKKMFSAMDGFLAKHLAEK